MRALTLIGRAGGDGWAWDYSCECGFRYRVAANERGAQFWPSNGPGRFSANSVRAGDNCVNCKAQLTLNGGPIHDGPTTAGFAAESLEPVRAHAVRIVDRDGDTTFLALQGEIDLYNAPELRNVLTRECALRPSRLMIDLSAVDFLDSTALHALLAARNQLSDRRGFVLVAPTPAVRRALEYSGLDRVLTVHMSPEPPRRLVA